jgi:hypothetical protein
LRVSYSKPPAATTTMPPRSQRCQLHACSGSLSRPIDISNSGSMGFGFACFRRPAGQPDNSRPGAETSRVLRDRRNAQPGSRPSVVGGMIRDVLIGALPPVAITNAHYFGIAMIGGLMTFYWYPKVASPSDKSCCSTLLDLVCLRSSVHKRHWITALIP